MKIETKLPAIFYEENGKEYIFPRVELQIFARNGRFDIYAKAPYLHPQVFQSDNEWLLMDLDPIKKDLETRNISSMVSLIEDYLTNCQGEIPCHKSYLNEIRNI